MVLVRAHHGAGLSSGIPRDSDYARAIAADSAERYLHAFNLYKRARRTFKKLGRQRPDDRRIAGWILKAREQMRLSMSLYNHSRIGRSSLHRRRYYGKRQLAQLLHRKWLAVRAFTGRGPKRLLEKALRAYREALRLKPSDETSRIYLAALHHEIGNWRRARQLFSRVRVKPKSGYQIPLAYYYTVSGDRRRALVILRHALHRSSYRYSPWKRYAYYNYFDRLRSDPEFVQLGKK